MNTIEKKSVNAASFISKEQVDTFTGSYKKERWADNSERMERTDSLSVWFSVEEIEEFLAQVKDAGGNAVRMHFGVIPQGFGDRPEVEGLQTIVMIGNRSKDGSYSSSRELLVDKTDKLAITSVIVCPPMCGSGPVGGGTTPPPKTAGLGQATIIDRGEKGMSII